MKREYSIEFVNNDLIDDEKYLWRYMSFHKFLSFLIGKELHFTRLDKFDDKREGISLKHLFFKKIKHNFENHPIFDKIKEYHAIDAFGSENDILNNELEKIQKSNFANCWVIGDKNVESYAMWNLYSDYQGIAIRINYRNFKNRILKEGFEHYIEDNILLGPVKYIDFQKEEENSNLKDEILSSVFIKDSSFAYENEYRIVIQREYLNEPINYKKNISKKYQEEFHKSINDYPSIQLKLINFSDYEFDIIFYPKSPKWVKENIKWIIEKSHINYKLFNSNLELS